MAVCSSPPEAKDGLRFCNELSMLEAIPKSRPGMQAKDPSASQGKRMTLNVSEQATAHPPSQMPRVLVIDDEETLLRALKRILRQGFEVVTAQGGRAGLGALDTESAFDVVLCDLMMPDVDGPAVYEHVSQNAPGLLPRMVFCSGGAISDRADAFVRRVDNLVLQKPVEPAELRRVLTDVARPKLRAL